MIVLACLCVPAAIAAGILSLGCAAKAGLCTKGEELSAEDCPLPQPNTEQMPAETADTAGTLRATVKAMGPSMWILTVLMALACGGCCLWAVRSGASWLTVCRVALAALALMSAAIIDGKTKLIPNKVSGGLLIAAAVALVAELPFAADIPAVLLRYGLGLVISFLLLLLFCVFSRGGFGMGDVKLVSSLGFMLGAPCAIFTMLFGMVVCALGSAVLLIGRKKGMKDHIPFAPYIFVGYIICILSGHF